MERLIKPHTKAKPLCLLTKPLTPAGDGEADGDYDLFGQIDAEEMIEIFEAFCEDEDDARA